MEVLLIATSATWLARIIIDKAINYYADKNPKVKKEWTEKLNKKEVPGCFIIYLVYYFLSYALLAITILVLIASVILFVIDCYRLL